MGVMKTLTINGVKYNVVPSVPTASVTLLASAWESSGSKHSQVVNIPGVTAHTKVDLQPTSEQLVEFHDKVLGFVAENDGGIVTVFSIGDKPSNNHTIQVTMIEVEATGKIRGNTVGTTMPRSDWAQTDPIKADYIKNKPTELNVDLSSRLSLGHHTDGLIYLFVDGVSVGNGIEEHGDDISALWNFSQNHSEAIPKLQEEDNTLRNFIQDLDKQLTDRLDALEATSGTPGKDGVDCTHEWNGTVLSITSASGTSSADLKGEKGDPYALTDVDKNTIVQAVKGVCVSKNQGAENVGKILVVGTDGNLVLTDMPEGGASGDVTGVLDESNNILLSGNLADGTYTLKYLNADGTYSDVGTIEVSSVTPDTPSYTNLLPLSVDASGNEYVGTNGEYGYKSGYRLNSSGLEKAQSGVMCTGFMPYTSDADTIYIKGITLDSAGSYSVVSFYDASKTHIKTLAISTANAAFKLNGDVWAITPNVQTLISDVAFFRFSAGTITDETIVTVNEPLE